jgi:6-phosphogluconolactonase (cycloisomerase 2 family)
MPHVRKITLLIIVCLAAALSSCGAPSTHLMYATLQGTNGVAAFRVRNSNATFTNIVGSPYPTGNSPSAVVVDPARKFAYVANQVDNTISRFAIDSKIGSLSEVTPRVDTGFSPRAMLMNSSGNRLFVLNQASNNITVYSVNSGALAEISGSPFLVSTGPVAMVLTPSGKFLYVLNSNLAVVFGYSVSSSGALTAIPGPPTPTGTGNQATGAGPFAIAVDPGEKFVYVANTLQNTLAILTINSSTGALAPIVDSPFLTGTSPTSLAVTTSGPYLYVANFGSNNVTAFSIDSSGEPTEISGSPFSTVGAPILLVSDPNGNFLYSVNQTTKLISALQITSGTGALTNGPSTEITTAAASSVFVTQ